MPISATVSTRSSPVSTAPRLLLLAVMALSLLLLGIAAAVPPWPEARPGPVRVLAAWRLQILAVGLSTLAAAGIVLLVAAEGL